MRGKEGKEGEGRKECVDEYGWMDSVVSLFLVLFLFCFCFVCFVLFVLFVLFVCLFV